MRAHKVIKTGKVIPNGVILAPHEYLTATTLTNYGYNIELIPPSNTPLNRNADLIMLQLVWEMKAPTGKSRHTMEHIFKKAARQSENLIIDLRRTKLLDQQSVHLLQKSFNHSRAVKRLWIITKDGQLLKLVKSCC